MINGAGRTANEAAKCREQDQQENEQKHQDENSGYGPSSGLIFATSGLENGSDSGAQPAVVIACLEAGRDFIIDDSFG